MEDLNVRLEKGRIEGLVSRYINAEVVITNDHSKTKGKLSMAEWSSSSDAARITFKQTITKPEIEDHILALQMRGIQEDIDDLVNYASDINSEIEFLEHLALHEIAHIKNNFSQDKETACDLWAMREHKAIRA
ncbi:hypothetical protein [Microbulbifer thermotolerans]|uniref:Uncharacterized protein n=1 Tax=Microbulbifer thermotolerans TaxID=252514 RepID=A0A143HP04_MICTH|nr:hypothetical protein [Microbulbifer thermotolerans]AMX03464.1 hypothetical protein A3224_13560 [Microbulbifer thermotolerans]